MSVSATVIHPQQGTGLHHETLDKVHSVHPQQATVLHFETRDNVHAFTRSQRPTIRGSSKIGIQCQCPQRSSTHNRGVVSIMRHGTMSTAFIRPQQATVLHLETHDNVHAFTRSQSPVLRGSSDLRQQSTALHLETHDNVHSVHPPTAARPLFPTLRHGTTSTLSHVVNAQICMGLQTPLAVDVHHGAARVPNGPAFGLQPSAVHEPQPAQGTP